MSDVRRLNMLDFRLITVAILIAQTFLAGCETSRQPAAMLPQEEGQPAAPLSPEVSQLTSADVLSIAKKTAAEEGLQLEDYNTPTVVYDDSHGQRQWWVHFDGKREVFGDHFSVRITDGTQTAEVYLGR
ncbi:hypothetical protein [Allorhodopirellula solitaria]|uniref:Uncharacterized protein n=1 Tax=Allorhodopirellula solitaria TaxID=2527987 RepID=A0A5C5XTN7_9BACT|nr:hypothetical protein [Allorhodopirellula solitaria]TWT66058.1 hypothetical protein CA85_29200 [Allorhodopirellula solitaria]